jgi:peptidoglycan hydrolase-like protein with peptidoglycan-binding domain
VEAQIQELTSDSGGIIEQTIPRTASTGRLLVKDSRIPLDIDVSLKIGHLDPVDQVEGQQARLNSLGYFAGEPGTTGDPRFKRAVEEFQRDNQLTVDGICGPQTQAKLKSVFGC